MMNLMPSFDFSEIKQKATFHNVTRTVDKYGDATEESSDTTVECLFSPQLATGMSGGMGAGVVSAGEVYPASIYLDGTGYVPDSGDEVTVAGKRWTIEGDPQVWYGAGVVVQLARFGA